MNLSETINLAFNILFSLILVGALNFIAAYLKQLCDGSRHKAIYNIIAKAVEATNQTYVEALKEQGKFDNEAQKAALQKTIFTVKSLLSDSLTHYIKSITGGNEDAYLTTQIESYIGSTKPKTSKSKRLNLDDKDLM